MIIHTSGKHDNLELDIQNRQILTPASAFGIFRKMLVSNIGKERLKGFLIRFGWEMGVNDAKQALKEELSIEELFKQGPVYHCMNGHITGTEYEGRLELDEHNQMVSLTGTGTWKDSYEALDHLQRFGISEHPVCHTLIGYASGFMTTISGQHALAKEVSCVGKGDSECRWVLKTQNEWDDELKDELVFYNERPIVKELQYTYEQLLEQKNTATKLMEFQKVLTEEIANGSNLQTIIDIVYNLIRIPILIEDIDLRCIAYSGISQDEFNNIQNDMNHYLKENRAIFPNTRKEKYQLPFQRKTIQMDDHARLIVTILIEKKVFGYCSFLYTDIKKAMNLEDDYMLLARIANAASLILLNEKTRFESFSRMKGVFLEQVLNGTIPSRKEIIAKGRYTGLNLGLPYYLTILEYKNKSLAMEDEFHFQEKILETISQYFKREAKNILIGLYEGNIILFINKEDTEKIKIKSIMQGLYQELKKNYPVFKFKLGISNEGNEIENLKQQYEEAFVALRLNSTKKVVLFKSLGIVGILINSNNMNGIKLLANQELGPLLNKEDPKIVELMKTLYLFLLNGGKLEQTLSDLSISMSGLLYRIKKIENMLDKDLRNPTDAYQLLLLIESLIALGEISL
ncbi:sugar diacid utilization regulator/predicted hydrocarbon binding protein [Neobacillus niacini]|uniref:XylR N-terminal domain-containing protein n=1 Tax=Neobacillus niacini TaxID=86668 RepID=UPI0028679D47|nr:XylR N-terminal domain-containing protein [Neobacillus niacini]MDR7077495.1 sugar diacid utilization regulator/predicted hydrocarbon binding protein [Neobacillus niacini]